MCSSDLLVAPFGLLPFGPAYGCWALAQIGLVVGAARLLWRALAPGPAPHPWVAYPLDGARASAIARASATTNDYTSRTDPHVATRRRTACTAWWP